MTNDPQQPKVDLTVVGEVKGYLDVSPKYVRLIGSKGKDLQQTVKIVPEKSYPFKITDIQSSRPDDFAIKLEPLGKDPRKEGYRLVVRNTRTEKGAYRGVITVKTDLKEKPTLRISVSGRIMESRVTTDKKP